MLDKVINGLAKPNFKKAFPLIRCRDIQITVAEFENEVRRIDARSVLLSHLLKKNSYRVISQPGSLTVIAASFTPSLIWDIGGMIITNLFKEKGLLEKISYKPSENSSEPELVKLTSSDPISGKSIQIGYFPLTGPFETLSSFNNMLGNDDFISSRRAIFSVYYSIFSEVLTTSRIFDAKAKASVLPHITLDVPVLNSWGTSANFDKLTVEEKESAFLELIHPHSSTTFMTQQNVEKLLAKGLPFHLATLREDASLYQTINTLDQSELEYIDVPPETDEERAEIEELHANEKGITDHFSSQVEMIASSLESIGYSLELMNQDSSTSLAINKGILNHLEKLTSLIETSSLMTPLPKASSKASVKRAPVKRPVKKVTSKHSSWGK